MAKRRQRRNPGPFSRDTLSLFNTLGFAAQLAAAYNLCSVSITEDLLTRAGFSQPTWATESEYLAPLTGAILGMFTLGYIGDRIGRHFAMMVAFSLMAIGALGSGLCGWGSATTIYTALTAFQFIAGVGIGGALPLSSTVSADSSAGHGMAARRLGLSWTYFGQSFGLVLPYLVALALWTSGAGYTVCWRGVKACGAVPVLFVFYVEGLTVREDAAAFRDRQVAAKGSTSKDVLELLCSRDGGLKLIGSGGSWFLANFVCNSVRTLAPTILEDFWNGGSSGDDEESLTKLCWQNILLSSMGAPGILATMFALSRWTPKRILITSSTCQFVLFVTLGLVKLNAPDNETFLFAGFCALNFVQSFGSGICNFMVTAELYAIEVRATFSGISAAMSQLGAMAGIVALVHWVASYGVGTAMLFMSMVCVLFFAVTVLFIPATGEMENDLMAARIAERFWLEEHEETHLLSSGAEHIAKPKSLLDPGDPEVSMVI